MEYLVPLVVVLVIIIAVVVASRFMGRKGRALQDAAGPQPRTAKPPRGQPQATREVAAEASAKLTPEAHRAVYSFIARHQVLNAVKAYRKATNASLGQSAAAVAALAQFPQASPEPAATEVPLHVEDILKAAPAPAPGAYRYRAIVSRGDEVREVASTRLNEELFGQIRSLALSGDYDGAAGLLRDHADISPDDAREFVSMIAPEE
ncbi:hypothetical protein CVV68_08165 [Arthrobacter livingstonensis]|uniref:Uncharacterized protein n=1 Tax=Arthrobacter livingstonensis TaxID=670078 RepID=A0A2V5LBE4_9MICC|nr:hypothetical protein [Arthrobacter livingstonensis]PYI67834.1 hypothetical protein CVV68_08165 [Arthrobacter livingstonensis]